MRTLKIVENEATRDRNYNDVDYLRNMAIELLRKLVDVRGEMIVLLDKNDTLRDQVGFYERLLKKNGIKIEKVPDTKPFKLSIYRQEGGVR